MRQTLTLLSLVFLATTINLQIARVNAAELYGLERGTVDLKSGGPLAFGPSGILFIGDPKAAQIYAVNTEDEKTTGDSFAIENLEGKISSSLNADQLSIADLAVNPETGNAFLSVTADGKSAIIRVSPDGIVAPLSLEKIANASVTLPNAPEDKVVQRGRRKSNPRSNSITDLAYTAGRILVAGLAAGEAPSSVRAFDFPFTKSG